jgi:peptidoglycan/LPS O-acetylase OafA/YrhL
MKNRLAENYFSAFYGRRALRILPVYSFCGQFSWQCGWAPSLHNLEEFSEGQVPFWNYFLLIQNFTMARTGEWARLLWALPGP